MKATILIDNITKNDLKSEWGLAVYIEYNDKKILLDTGTTGAFIDNANALNININDVDFGVLSHAHYDHSDGLDRFFENNDHASFYIRKGTSENCYSQKKYHKKYIGIKKGTLEKYKERIVYADGDYKVAEGVYLIPHKKNGLENIAKAAGLYIRKGFRMVLDDFSHEQSLVLRTEDGLVIFNSCSHGGVDNIIDEISKTFPGEKICCLIGGLHLYKMTDEEVKVVACKIKNLGIKNVITGHCTGDRGYQVLKDILGDKVEQMYTGMEINI